MVYHEYVYHDMVYHGMYTTGLQRSWILCRTLTLKSIRRTNWPSLNGTSWTCSSCWVLQHSAAIFSCSLAPSKATCSLFCCSRTHLCTLPASGCWTIPSRKSTGSYCSCLNIKYRDSSILSFIQKYHLWKAKRQISLLRSSQWLQQIMQCPVEVLTLSIPLWPRLH